MTYYKALSVRQPWAHLILMGQKPVENRTWKTDYRGPLLIHAGTQPDPDALEALGEIGRTMGNVSGLIMEWMVGTSPGWKLSTTTRRGAILGQVDLVGVTKDSASAWFSGPYGWLLRNPVVFREPIPYKGRPGLFDVPEEVLSAHL